MNSINMKVSVPICSFRKAYAREYMETERIPPPSTVYGFLLSLVGEEDRRKYIGTRLAIAITHTPAISTVLRTTWRIKSKGLPPGIGSNRRPDYKEILTNLEIGIWIYTGELYERLLKLNSSPKNITRYGGLSMGESTDLVDEVKFFPKWEISSGEWLYCDDKGMYPLPVWVDHVGSKNTKWVQFRLNKEKLDTPPENDPRWIEIRPPDVLN